MRRLAATFGGMRQVGRFTASAVTGAGLMAFVAACAGPPPEPVPTEVTFELGSARLVVRPGAPCRPSAPPPGVFTESRVALGVEFVHEMNAVGPTGEAQVRDLGGVGVGDLDGDGALDLYFANSGGPDQVYLTGGRGPGQFRSAPRGGSLPSSGVVVLVDLDGDGHLDALLGGGEPRTVWVRGDGRGGFSEPTDFPQVGTLEFPPSATGFSAADVDGDGALDVCTATHVVHHADGTNWPAREWMSQMSGGGLVDQDGWLPLSHAEDLTFACALVDLDDDGDADMLEVNDAWSLAGLGLDASDTEVQGSRVIENVDGSLRDVSVGSGADPHISAMGVGVGDYDNDGRLDLYVTSMMPLPSALLQNLGDLRFRNVSYDAEVDTLTPEHDVGWGALFADADSDGWLDLYVLHGKHVSTLGNSGGAFANADAQPNVLLRNRGDGTFEDVTDAARVGDRGWSRSPAQGDLNGDGFVDLVVGNTNGPPSIYLNGCDDRPWLRVSLRAPSSPNTHAVGARVRTNGGGLIQTRVLMAGGDGLYGSSALEATFGFPVGTDVADVEVRWPDGTVTTVGQVPTRRALTFTRTTPE